MQNDIDMHEALANLRVAPKTVQTQTVENLRSAIVNGVFKPGERLVESRLCAVFGVSRPAMREALRSIEAEKLITITPNVGPIVSVLSWEDAAEIYGLRSMLEGEAADLCAQRASSQGIEGLRNAVSSFRQSVQDRTMAGQIAATQDFYDVLLRECGNRLIREILGGLIARINLLRVRSMSLGERSTSSAKELEAIFKAIERRDPVAARAAAILHVEKACASARVIFKQQANDGATSAHPAIKPKRPRTAKKQQAS